MILVGVDVRLVDTEDYLNKVAMWKAVWLGLQETGWTFSTGDT